MENVAEWFSAAASSTVFFYSMSRIISEMFTIKYKINNII